MRPDLVAVVTTLAALAALAATGATSGCAARDRPYQFGSPMLGAASVPPAPLDGDSPGDSPDSRNPGRPRATARAATPVRSVSAPAIREVSASAAAALEVAALPAASAQARDALAAPHRIPSTAPLPAIHTPDELRALVGRRAAGDPTAVVLAWARDLGGTPEGTTADELLAWAERTHHLGSAFATPAAGDLVVFDRATSDDAADLIAVVLAHDPRGVTEMLYLGGGVVRRGFLDPSRADLRRDADARVVNTYLRHGKRWPAPGTHYLAGELLGHVVVAH